MQLGWQVSQEDLGLWQLVVNEKVIDLEGKGMFELRPGVDKVFVRQAVCPGNMLWDRISPIPLIRSPRFI